MKQVETSQLDASFVNCDEIMAEQSQSFYQAFHLLPAERFKGVTALYAFNRYVDDLADDSERNSDESLEALAELEISLENLYKTNFSEDNEVGQFNLLPWWEAFRQTLSQYRIPLAPLLSQIRGQRFDLEGKSIETLEDLIQYSRLVAGSVGEMMLPLLVKDDQAITQSFVQAASNLGVGMQITNILRDIGEDYHLRERIYLPSDLMVKYGVTERLISELITQRDAIPQNMIDLWEELSDDADVYYGEIIDWLSYFHKDAQLPLVTAALSYQGIAEAVRQSGYDCFRQRNYTSQADRKKFVEQAKSYLTLLNESKR